MPKINVTVSMKMDVPDDLNTALEEGKDPAFDNLENQIATKLGLPVADVTVADVWKAE